jgi:hypothetical protein
MHPHTHIQTNKQDTRLLPNKAYSKVVAVNSSNEVEKKVRMECRLLHISGKKSSNLAESLALKTTKTENGRLVSLLFIFLVWFVGC